MARVVLALMYKMTTGLRHIATEPATLKVEKLSGPMQQKKSPQARSKIKSVTGTGSDSVRISSVLTYD